MMQIVVGESGFVPSIASQTLPRRKVYLRGLVQCVRCASPISVREPNAVAEEFCVPCPRCGHRAVHSMRSMQVDELSERRENAR
jgi:DNA-directed RNA polymerase subunit RPC12/RpoP